MIKRPMIGALSLSLSLGLCGTCVGNAMDVKSRKMREEMLRRRRKREIRRGERRKGYKKVLFPLQPINVSIAASLHIIQS